METVQTANAQMHRAQIAELQRHIAEVLRMGLDVWRQDSADDDELGRMNDVLFTQFQEFRGHTFRNLLDEASRPDGDFLIATIGARTQPQ